MPSSGVNIEILSGRWILWIVLSAFLLLLLAHSAYATTYYVDNCVVMGNDSNNGNSPSTPWLTIAKVNSSTFDPGDSVLFRSGCTWREELAVPSSGKRSSPVTFGAYGNGALPIISGADLLTSWTAEPVTPHISLVGAITRSGEGTTSTINVNLPSGAGVGDYVIVWLIANYNSGCQTTSSLVAIPNSFITGNNGREAGAWGYYYTSPPPSSVSFTCNSATTIRAISFAYAGVAASSSVRTSKGEVSSTGTATLTSPSITAGSGDQLLMLYSQATDATFSAPSLGTIEGSYNSGCALAVVDSAVTSTGSIGNQTLTSSASAGFFGVQIALEPASRPFTAYYASVSTQPNQVFENGVRYANISSETALTPGTFYWESTDSRVYIRTSGDSSPTGYRIEASQRNYAITSTQSYVTVSNLQTQDANLKGIYFNGGTGITVAGVLSQYNYDDGVRFDHAASSMVNLSTAQFNGANGFATYDTPSFNFSRLIAHDDCDQSTNSDSNYCAGIKLVGTIGTNETVQYSTSYSNGNGQVSTSGAGIWADTVGNGLLIEYNRVYSNNHHGITVEASSNSTIVYNVSYANGQGDTNGYGIIENMDTGVGQNNVIYGNTVYGNSKGIGMNGPNAANSCIDNAAENDISTGNTNNLNFTAIGGCENDGTMGFGNVYMHNNFGPESFNFIEWGSGTYFSTYAAFDAAYGTSTHSVAGDPQFTNAAGHDFTLSSSSTAIDAGRNLGCAYEMGLGGSSTWPDNVVTLNQSDYGSGWDIGAYVYTQTSTPSVTITTPLSGTAVLGNVSVSASSTAVSPASVASVQFYLDGGTLGSPVTTISSPDIYTYSWNTASTANGSHTLSALALDNYGNTATSSAITVTVANTAAAPLQSGAVAPSTISPSTGELSRPWALRSSSPCTALGPIRWR